MPLMLFFHGYSADSEWATERFFLDMLNKYNYVVMALNGRQDDLGFPYWLGSSRFQGIFGQEVLENGTVKVNVGFKGGHLNLTSEQQRMMTEENPDIEYVRRVINYALDVYNIDPTRIYVMGTALGGDFVNMLACNMSDILAGIITNHGYGFYEEDAWAYCKPTHPIHVLMIEAKDNGIIDESLQDFFPNVYVPFWTHHNKCNETELPTKISKTVKTTISPEVFMDTDVYSIMGCQNGGSLTYWNNMGPHYMRKSRTYFPISLVMYLAYLSRKDDLPPTQDAQDALDWLAAEAAGGDTEHAQDGYKYQGYDVNQRQPSAQPRSSSSGSGGKRKTAINWVVNEYMLGYVAVSVVVLAACFFCVYRQVQEVPKEEESAPLSGVEVCLKECELRNYEAFQNAYPGA
eukprot:1642497-Pyramimonas_sp.AAC.2